MTQEQWDNLKVGDIIIRGYDQTKVKVLAPYKDGKKVGYILRPIEPTTQYEAWVPQAYEVAE